MSECQWITHTHTHTYIIDLMSEVTILFKAFFAIMITGMR